MKGTEILLEVTGYSFLQSGLLISLILILGFIGYKMGVSIDQNSKKFDEERLKKRRINHLIRSIALCLFLIAIFSTPILHSVDTTLNLTKTDDITITDIDGNRYYLFILDDENDKYRVSREVKGFDDDKIFECVGYRCDIEYYRLSKIIKRIVILE